MVTEKFGLHTIEYSVQGWDAIMNTDMEQLDDAIPSRILGTLGEAVTAYQCLYLKAADSKWYKAQADGAKQGEIGLALEAGGAEDSIRIYKMGEVTNAGWAWATVGGAIYIDPSTAGAMTQTNPVSFSQMVGRALSATKMLVLPESFRTEYFSRGGTILVPSGAVNVIAWRAPWACTVLAVKGYRVGGTGAEVNARRNGADNHLAAALSLVGADAWADGGAVQNTAYVVGDKLEIMVVSVADDPTQIAIQVDFRRP
jgi:hypothetical protein